MPRLLDRFILADLLKVFTLTVVVLTCVIAFGAVVKPLAEGLFVSPVEAIVYMLLVMVPMLQFALPFAAGFASTIVLHRMASDNEIVAAAASGVSYRRLLAPVVVLGVLLTLLMVVLTQSVIPRFGAQAERMIAADLARLLQIRVEQGLPLDVPNSNVQIYADDLRIVPNPPDTEADSRLILLRVAVVELDREGRVDRDITAGQAVVDMYRRARSRGSGDTLLKLVMRDAVAYEGSSGTLARSDGLVEPHHAIVLPSPFRDHLRTMTRAELRAMRNEPERHGGVRDHRDALVSALTNREVAIDVNARLHDRGEIELVQSQGGAYASAGSSQPAVRRYIVQAERFVGGEFFSADGGPVSVEQFSGETLVRRVSAETVRLGWSSRSAFDAPLFNIDMRNTEVTDVQAGVVNRRRTLPDQNLLINGVAVESLFDAPLQELVMRAASMEGAADAARRLERRIDSLNREITSRTMARYAQSATAVLLLTLGATLAMWLRGSLPLVTYLWSFLPSILTLIMISGGDKMMRDGGIVSGVSVMWGGNLALLLLFVFAFWKLSKN